MFLYITSSHEEVNTNRVAQAMDWTNAPADTFEFQRRELIHRQHKGQDEGEYQTGKHGWLGVHGDTGGGDNRAPKLIGDEFNSQRGQHEDVC